MTNFNPFIFDYKTRLAAWKELRNKLNDSENSHNKLVYCCAFWQKAPLENQVIDWDNAATWPDAWTMIAKNNYCESTLSLAVAYTLILANSDDKDNTRLLLITDRKNQIQKIVLQYNDWIVNHGWLDINAVTLLKTVEINRSWRFNGKNWIDETA